MEALPDALSQKVNVDGFVVQERFAAFGDADDRQILRGILHPLYGGHLDIETELHYVSCDHKDDQQDKNYVNERDDIDFRHSGGTTKAPAAPATPGSAE